MFCWQISLTFYLVVVRMTFRSILPESTWISFCFLRMEFRSILAESTWISSEQECHHLVVSTPRFNSTKQNRSPVSVFCTGTDFSSILLRVYRTMVYSTVIGLYFVLPWFHHSAIVLVECIAVPLCFSSVKNLHRFCFLTQKFLNMPAAAKLLRNFRDKKQISEEDAVSLDRHFTIGQTQTSFLFFQNKSAKSHKR